MPPSLKLTFFALANQWLEDEHILLGPGIFSGAMLVSVRVIVEGGAVFFSNNRGKKKTQLPQKEAPQCDDCQVEIRESLTRPRCMSKLMDISGHLTPKGGLVREIPLF